MVNITVESLKNKWPKRNEDSHKGNFGHVLIIAGNKKFGGAGILSSSAAVYAGAGLVTLATDPINFTAVHSRCPEIMLINFNDFQSLEEQLATTTGVVIGPGLGDSEESLKILEFTLKNIKNSIPLVIDGSAISLIVKNNITVKHQNLIFTPHQKEWERLSGIKIENQDQQLNQNKTNILNAYVILKKHHTEIYSPNLTMRKILAGNPGMATGGSGDTLTGILIALISQTKSLDDGVILGTFLHSYVADQIYKNNAVVIPHILIQKIPIILKQLQKKF